MSVKIEKITPPVSLGEGPHWDVRSQKLFYVDLFAGKIFRYDPETKKITSAQMASGPCSVIIPVEGTTDKFVAGNGTDIVLLTWDGETDVISVPTKKLASIDTDRSDTQTDDGKCDSTGRLWIGTMATPDADFNFEKNIGSFYSIDKNFNPKKQYSPVSISNGLAWNSKGNVLYYNDSFSYEVWAFDFNLNDGTISNKRVVFDLKKNNIEGIADGMTIDTDDNLWVANFGGGGVLQIDPRNGKLLRYVKLPAELVTSVAFGGPSLDILYVTTSNLKADNVVASKETEENPDAGCVFSIKGLGVKGYPANNFKMA